MEFDVAEISDIQAIVRAFNNLITDEVSIERAYLHNSNGEPVGKIRFVAGRDTYEWEPCQQS